MDGKRCDLGISLYPDFYSQEELKQRLDFAHSLGYKRVFTSIQLGDLGFENASEDIGDNFKFLFDYCKELNITCHVDINDVMLNRIGATPDNLEAVAKLNIPVIRLDGGFTFEEIATMTTNPHGIIIEDNLSNFCVLEERLETVKRIGNFDQYYACHNFFPRNDTGIGIEDAVKYSRMFNAYGCKTGVFIGSLYSKNDLNAVGSSVMTVEAHRYLPSAIQVSDLLSYNTFDYILFGDSDPRSDELIEVSKANHLVCDVISEEQVKMMHPREYDLIKNKRVIDVPVFFDGIDEKTIQTLKSIVFFSRVDIASYVIRGTYSRGVIQLDPQNTIERAKYAITIDNKSSNRYTGEMQIMLRDLPASRHVNVVGYVKPYATCLLEMIHQCNVAFRLV